ncbi:MAG TPA: SBBP repeat-containing protein, partial [Bryobacteraceae bacterium]|nr:SBBP repeat-containing protein [Bryobacteraceae bacterium]
YDEKLPLIIDPVLEYMSVLGGSAAETATAVTTDSAGNMYVAGTTNSTNFPVTTTPTSSPLSSVNPDIFVTKMDPRGVTILYSIYFGGSQSESPGGIQVDNSGAVYLAGITNSNDFPVTSGAYNPSGATAPECFATKLNATGTAFVYSALLGSCGNGSAQAIAIDSAGDAYITGFAGTGFPTTPGAFTPTASTSTGFALELNPQGTTAVYSTYIPGSSPGTIAVDATGTAYIAGATNPYSSFVTTSGAAQTVYGGGLTDAFVLRISTDGSTLLFSTLLGGSHSDSARAIAVDGTGAVYVTGLTSMGGPYGPNSFPITAGAAFRTPEQGFGFLTKLNPSGTHFVFSTYLENQSAIGSSGAVALDTNGNVYVAAYTSQSSALTENNIGGGLGVPGIGILKFSADGTMLLDSKFFAFSVDANRNGFWFQKKILAPQRVGEPVGTVSLQALYVVGSENQPGAAISDSDRVYGPGGSSDASIMKVDMSVESSDEFQVDATYLLYNSVLGTDFNYLPSTKTISLTSSGAPLPFHIVTPSTISVSQTDGTTPAQVAVTYTPTQQNVADPLLIITPGAKESYKLLAVSNGGQTTWSVPSAIQLQADPITGIGTATLAASLVQKTGFGSATDNVPFVVQPVGNGGFPSWLQVSPASGTTPTTITLTGNASGLSGTQSTQIQLVAGSATTTVNVSLVPNSAPANLTVIPQSLEFNFPPGATATQSQQITVGSTGVPLAFEFGTASTGFTFTPSSGTTPATATVTADPTQMPEGLFDEIEIGSVSVPGTGTIAHFNLEAKVGSTPISVSQIFDSNPPSIAVGALVNISGAFYTNGQTFTAVDFPWPTTLGGYQVTINGVPLPLGSVSPEAIETQMPFDLAPGQVNIAVTDPYGNVLTSMVPVVASKLTAISNPAAAYKLDGSVVSPDNPVAPGDTVLLEFTGQGKIFPPVAPGSVPVAGERALLGEKISATIGGMPALIQSTAMSSTMPGVLVIDVQVPDLRSDDYYAQVMWRTGISPVVPVSVQK